MPLPAYVYAPFNGDVNALDCRCSCSDGLNCGTGCKHIIPCGGGSAGWQKPIDIGGAAALTAVKFYGSSQIKSIRTTKVACVCLPEHDPGLIARYGVSVDLYLDTGGVQYIGTMLYGHLDKTTRIANNLYSSGLSGKQIGKIANCCGSPCSCDCSSGPHVHSQAKGPVIRNTFNCESMPVQGSTWIYQWSTI